MAAEDPTISSSLIKERGAEYKAQSERKAEIRKSQIETAVWKIVKIISRDKNDLELVYPIIPDQLLFDIVSLHSVTSSNDYLFSPGIALSRYS